MDWPRIARIADNAVVAALAVSAQVLVWTADSGPLAENRPVHALLLAVVTVPLFVRRSRPLLVLLLVLGARPRSWRSAPRRPSGRERNRRPGPSPTSAPASPANCTTSSRTAWA